MDLTFVRRVPGWTRHVLWGLLLLATSVSAQGLRDRSAWEVLVPHARPVDCVLWQGLVVVADDGGGLMIYDPSAGAFEAWTTREGLTTNQVTAVDADGAGRLWVATRGGGVVRFDAAGVARSITGLLDSEVTDLAADGDVVYYGTLRGAGRIADGFPEQVFQVRDGLPSNEVRVVAARGGVAWFGTAAGVARFDRATNQLEAANTGLGADLGVLDLQASDLGVFVSTADGVFAWGTSSWSALTAPPAPIRRLVLLADHVLGIGAGNSAWDLDPLSDTWTARALDATTRSFSTLDNSGQTRFPGAVAHPDGRLYFAATLLDPASIRNNPQTTVWVDGQGAAPTLRGLFGSNIRGLAVDGQGGAWFGAFPVFDGVTHWRADGSAVAYALRDDDPSDAVDQGWMQALKIANFRDSRGDVWVSTFQQGVTRLRPSPSDDPASGVYLHLRPEDSPLRSRRVVAMAEDAEGHVWFASDGASLVGEVNSGLDILLDPSRPTDSASWTKVTPTNSRLGGHGITAIDFRRRGEVWLSVTGLGLQSWNYDGGSGSGSLVPSALMDTLQWRTLDRLPNSASGIELSSPRGVEFAADGRAWLATADQGVFRFDPGPFASNQPWEVDQIKQSPFGVSLLSSLTRWIALDRDGALWVATDAGLDRITETTDGYRVDAFTDLPTFEDRDLVRSYLPAILSPLPGANVNTLAITVAEDRLYVATQTGVARIRLDQLTPTSSRDFSFQLHPNPVRSGDPGLVVAGFEGVAVVEIYTLTGVQLVRRTEVLAGDQVWDTRNRLGDNVASGMYVVRVETAAGVTQRTVAIER